MAAKRTGRDLLCLLRVLTSVVIDGVYEETNSCERDFPPRLYSPAPCNGRKLNKEVGHHQIRESGCRLNRLKFSTTGWTTSSHNSRKAAISLPCFFSGPACCLTDCWNVFTNRPSFSGLVPSGTLTGVCLCGIMIASQDELLVMRTMIGPSRAAS